MQLAAVEQQFINMGINVAAISYDSVAKNARFHKQHQITYPLLSDVDFANVNAWGILNTEHEPGDMAYGIPYPGMAWIDSDGTIRLKFAEENFRERPDFSEVIDAIQQQLDEAVD